MPSADALGALLAGVAQILESGNGTEQPILRVFELLREQVPYERCALLEVQHGSAPSLVVVPAISPEARTALIEALLERHRELGLEGRPVGAEPVDLLVPLVGVDGTVGVVHVSRDAGAYEEHHQRALALVGAQLGAHLTTLRAPRSIPPVATTVSEKRPPAPLAGVRVLFVDDEADIREAFQLVLEHFGAEVVAVSAAASALETLARWRPDVLLSDLAMPGESGFDLMRQLAALADAPPAAAVTAQATDEGRERALAAGFRMYLAKPIDASTLVAAVAELAGRPRPAPRGGRR